ncbi:MAG: FtsX-like permease family protein [Blautia sp.]|jgi:putative ABC transport system permease protein|uniref:FtsX-like permease family protein n=1 Tax=unclassified Blautia TaxID=2648079 RepID=UPI0039911B83
MWKPFVCFRGNPAELKAFGVYQQIYNCVFLFEWTDIYSLVSIISRIRKKFALMRSVGMSQKQLTRMICCEGLIIVAAGLVLSILAGGGMGFILCGFLKQELMTYLKYQFPVGILLIYCIVVLLCSLAITEGVLRRQRISPQIDLLRG